MASNDNLLKLYNGLKDNNFSVPDNFESFERTLAAPGNEGVNNRQTLYKALKRSNYSVPDNYESFRNTLFGPDIDLAGEALGEQAGTEAGTTKTETGPEAGGESPLTSERPPETVERQPAATETQPAVSADSAQDSAKVRMAYGVNRIRNMVDPQFRSTTPAPTPAGDALAEVEAGRKNAVEAWKEVQRSMSPSWLQSAKGAAASGDVAASMRSTFAQPGEDASTVMQKAAVIRRARERREAERRWENPDLLRDRVEEVIDRAEQEAATVGTRAGAGAPVYAQSFMAGTQEQAQKAANLRINDLSMRVIEAMAPDIDLIADRLRASGGYTEEDVQYEIQNYMESTIPQYIYETLKSRNTPKNDLEYITSSTYGQWMSTALTDYISGKLGGSKEYRQIQQQSLQDYVAKLQPIRATALELTSGVLGMATDPTNALLMGVGGMAAGKAADWTFRRSAASLMARGTSQGVKVETALRMLPANLAYRTTMRLAQGSGSFAAFEMGSQAKQDIGAGEFSGWGVYGSKLGKGLALGAATAGAGVFIGSASKRLEKALLDRGANSAAVGAVDVATKIGVAPAVEAALFTAGEVATGDKGVSEYTAGEIGGMFGSNLGFVYGMKLWHGPEKVIKERFKDNPRAQKWFTSVRDAVAHPVRTLRDIGERARLLDDGLLTADEWKNVERVLGYDIRSLKGMARAAESAGSITNSRGRTQELFQGLSMAMTSQELSLREKAVVSSLFGMRMAIPDVAKVEREGNVVSTYDTRGQLVRRVDGGSDKAAEQLFVSGQQAVDMNNLFYLQMGIADRYNAEDLPADVLERMWAVACKRAGVDSEKYTDPVKAVKMGSDPAAKAVLEEWRSMMWELASRRPVGMPEASHRVALKDGREGSVVAEAETENAVTRSKQRWLTVELPDGSRIIVDEGAVAEEQRLPMSAEERLTSMMSALDMTALGKSQREAVELWLRDRNPDEALLVHARLAGRIIDGTASEEERAEAERLGVDVEFFRKRLNLESETRNQESGTEAGGESPLTSERPPETVERQPAATETQPAVSADSALPVMADGTPDIARAADAESGRRAVLEMFDGDTVAAREYVAATMGALEAEAEALRKPQGYGRELADNIRRRRSLEKKIERLKEIDNALTETPAEQLPTEPEINKAAGDSGRVPVYADGTPNFLAAKPVDAYDALLKWMGGDKGAADDYIMEMRIRLEKELRSAPEGRKTDIMRELDKWTAIAQEASRRETEAGLAAKKGTGTEAVLPKKADAAPAAETGTESGLTKGADGTEAGTESVPTKGADAVDPKTGEQQAGQDAQQPGTVSADSAPDSQSQQTASQKALDDFRTRRVEEHLSPELKGAINDLRLKLQGVSAPALVNGWHESGKVFVNVDRETGARSVWIVGHEIGHEMEDLDPVGYDRWRTSVMDELYARDEEGTQQQFREFKDAYFNQVYRSRYNEEIAAGRSADEAHRRASDYADSVVTDEYVYTEMANNFLGDLAADAATARRAFASMEPGLATRVARYIGRFYTRLLEAVGADEAVARRRAGELADDFNLIYRQQVKRLNEEHQDGEIERAVSERTDGVAFNADGEVVAEVTDGVPRFSLYTWENGGRDALKRYLEGQIVDPKRKSKKKDSKGPRTPQPGLTRREVDNMMKEMDRMHAYAMELAKGNPNGLFGQWSVQTVRMVDGTEVPLLRALKDNAEYRLNIDFSTVCKKRMVMDALMNDLIRRGWLQHESLSPQDVARINQIIQQHGLEIACGICFVDSRRYNATKFAEGFLNKFNPIVESLGTEAPAGFNYSGNTAFSNEGKRDYSAVTESVDWSRVFSPEGIDEVEMAKYELDWHAVAGILEPLRVRAARYMRGKKAVEKVDGDGKKLKDKDGNPEVVEVDCNFDAEFDAARRKQYDAELARMIQADRRAKGLPAAKSDIKAAEYEAAWMEYRKQLPEPSASERWNFAWAKMMNGGNAQQKMAMAISQSPELRKVAKVEDFIASEGWENVRQQNTGLERLWNIQKGAAGAKPNERFAPYQNDVLEKKLPNADIYDIGGYRMQSFSDFVGRMYFDYLQAFADLAAMQLPGHAYTKEPNFVKLFGMMGMKINMSLVCDVDGDVVRELGKDFAGLTRDADGNLTYNVAETVRGTDGEIIKQGQTFPAEEAFALQADPRFSRNAGTIMVGLSREHILMGLRDPRIRMVIPYHKSGLPHGVAMILNLSEINDYEPVQSTRRRDGKKMTAADRHAVDNYNFILHQLSIAKDRELAYNALRYIMVERKMTGEIHEEYNKALRRVKADRAKNPDSYRRIDISERERDDTFIAKVAADIYLDACDAHGYIPRFDEFRGEHGYYKTLVDFSVYDHEGNYAPQEAVRFQLPERVDEYIRESLEHDEGINAKAVSENEGLIADIVTYLGNRELRDRQDAAAEKKKDEAVLRTIYNVGDFRNVPEVVAVAPSGPEGSPSPDRGSRIADALGVPAERRYSLSPEGRAEAVGRVGAERQKLPGARLTENTLKLDWADPELRWSLSRNARQQVEGWLRKRGDLSDEERGAVVDYIDKDIEDRKVQLAAGWWSAKGSVRLPEDLEKIKQAVKVAEVRKGDFQRYDSPMALIEDLGDIKTKEPRIDPESVPTLHRAKELPEGVVIYDVDEGQQSRENMRRIINTHFGPEASPWCLLQGDGKGNLTEKSAKYWNHYSVYPKQVAFKDGKLLAFSANDSDKRVWWDRQDKATEGIPSFVKVPGDELGRSRYVLTDTETGEVSYTGNYFKGDEKNGIYQEWAPNGQIIKSENRVNGEKEGLQQEWYDNGLPYREVNYNDGLIEGLERTWYNNGNLWSSLNYKNGELDGEAKRYNRDGVLRNHRYYKNGHLDGEYTEYYPDGHLMLQEHWKNGRAEGETKEWWENGNLRSLREYRDDERNGVSEEYEEDGRLRSRYTYVDGMKDGPSMLIYRDEFGTFVTLGNYKRGGLVGESINYRTDGKSVSITNYGTNERPKYLFGDEAMAELKARGIELGEPEDPNDPSGRRYSLRRPVGGNSGYVGYSMSKRAAEARSEGRFPKTDFRKVYDVKPKLFDVLVKAGIIDDSEWHHTSMYGNKTTFYSWADEAYLDIFNNNRKLLEDMVKGKALKNPYSYKDMPADYMKERMEYTFNVYNPESARIDGALKKGEIDAAEAARRYKALKENETAKESELMNKYPEARAVEENNNRWTEYQELILRNGSDSAESVKQFFEQKLREQTLAENAEFSRGDDVVRYSLRTKPDPKKTIKVYKLMRLGADGKLYPLFIDSAAPIELRRWYDGDAPDFNMLKKLPSGIHLLNAQTGEYVMDYDAFFNEHKEMFNGSKKGANPSVAAINWATENGYRFINIKGTERAQKRYGGENRQYYNLGINGSGSVSEYAMRPGWHAGTHPTMRQIGKGKNRDLRDDSFVWVEGEIAADNDYNAEAQGNPDKDLPGKMPVDGYYLKATNADKKKSQADRMGWYVSGAFRANRIISDAEARGVIDEWNAAHPEKPIDYDYKREGGKEFTEEDARRVNGANGVDSPAADRRYSLANEQRRDIAMAMERATGHSVRFGRPPRGAAGFDVAGHLIVDPDRCASAAAVESAVGHVLADALPLPTLSSPELYNSTMDNIWRNLPEAVREGYAGRGTNDAERVVQYLADVAQDKSGAGRRAWNAAINGFRSAVRRQRGIRLETGDIELSLLEHLASANSSPLLKAEAVRARRDWEVADELSGRDASLEDEVVTVSTSDGGRRRFVALSEIDALRASITEAKEEELEANVRAVERYLRDRLSPEIATRFGKRKILELADRLKDGAVSKRGLQEVLMQAEMAIGESEMRAAMDSLRKTLKTPTMRINSRQEREANRVDADTAAFFGALRDNLQEVLRKTYSDDEVELRSTIKDLNARIDSGVLSEEELAAAREELKTANRELDVAREERKKVEAVRAHDSFVAVEDRYRDLSQRLMSGGQLSDSERRELSALPLRLRVMRVNALMRDFLAAVNAPADERAVIASDMLSGGTYDAVIDAYLAQVAQLPASKVNDRIKMQRAITAEIRELTDILTGRLEDGRLAYQEWQGRIAAHDSDLLKAAVNAVGGAREIAPARRSRARRVAQRYFGSLRDSVWDAYYDTLNHMVQMIDVRSMPKNGFLYNYFITSPETGYMANYGRYIDLRNSYRDRVKRKMEELLPKEERDRYNEEHAIVLSLRDGEGNVIRQFERSYTVGQLMYEYLLSRMRSGREKLRMMGFDEAAQSAVGRALGSGYMDLADWISDTLLDDLYQEQNRTYRALHGINLGRVVNYFPFRYSQQEVSKPGDLVEEYVQSMTSGISSEKHRTANNKALDLTQDAMSILDRHIDNGARQAAMGRFNRDLSVLLSSGEFVEALRAQGASLPDRFRRVCNLAAGVERRNSEAELQNFVNRMLSGGCIAYRLNTALKQLLSLPAFALEGDNISWGKDLAQATLDALRRGDGNSIRWCYEHLPIFRDRWDSRALGDIRMVDENLGRISNMLNTKGGVEVVGKKVMDASGNVVRVGMLPNGLIDILACSMGAKAMYEHRLRRYLDEVDARLKVWAERYGEDNPGREKERELLVAQAYNWAKACGEQVYNESQQSALSAFTSPMQNSGSLWARMTTLFKSAGLSYGRKGIEYLVGAGRALRGLPAQESIVVQSLVPDEADFIQLPQQETTWGRTMKTAKSLAGAWLFLQGLNLLWNAGGMYLGGVSKGVSAEDYMAEMTDDDSSVNMMSALLAVHPYAERTYSAFTGKTQGDLGGTLIEDVVRDYNKSTSFGQASAIVAKAALVAGSGVQLETFSNMVTGVEGMLTDGSVDYEDIQYVLNSPQMSGIFRNAKGKYGGMLRRGEVSGSEYIGRMLFALKCNDLGEKGFVLDSRRGYTDYDVDKVLGEYVDIVAPDYSDWKERNKDAEVPESKPERFRAVDNTLKRLREIYKSGDASRRGEVDELHRGLVKLLSEMPQRRMDERLAADEALLKEYSRLQRENGKASALEFMQEHRREIERAKRYRRQRGVVDAKVNDFLDGLVPIEEVRRERERLDAVLLEE